MRSPKAKRYTVDNNVRGTHNLLCALTDAKSDAAVVHLGTMGVYGYGLVGHRPDPRGLPDREGADSRWRARAGDPAPGQPRLGLPPDQDARPAAVLPSMPRTTSVRITDLHQGIVWGTQTAQTGRDERLINRFDYDGDYGTVLNRFLMQAAIGHPLTVHGSGGQTRAFIHIRDTVRCIEIALANPPEAGCRADACFNQITETHRVLELAKMVGDTMGVEIAYLPNPRQEADENELCVRNDQFLALGLEPTTLSEGLLEECTEIAARYRDRADVTKIVSRSVWRAGMETSDDLLTVLPRPAAGGLNQSADRGVEW